MENLDLQPIGERKNEPIYKSDKMNLINMETSD
ncbi:hypothetical protein NTHI1209_00706 [Haemophilus influenzae]|uniref:Uncharacterized protein n=1 Tax=Haemophilus influenzae TaxID=727 RepID=A0A158SW59_HAEIF|nr:hypothetical protein NTHI1209_00706 [Haemophilus influenzae]